jgi:SAM-dependent methyltransferase
MGRASIPRGRRYGRDYYERWYRNPATRVKSAAELARTVAVAVALAEYHLERPIRRVLDVGCGEGRWRAPLLRLRPRIDYLGVDASDWAVARWGTRRNLQRLDLAELGTLKLRNPVDLLVCNDVIQYVPDAVLEPALAEFRRLCGGLMFVTAFTAEDEFIGDRAGWHARPASWYRERLAADGWSAIGSHAYIAPPLAERAAALERAY